MTLPVLDDAQQIAVIDAMRPLGALERDAFLNALEHLLNGRTEVGPGELFKLLRSLQKEIFKYPKVGPDVSHSNSLAHRTDARALKKLGCTRPPESGPYRRRPRKVT